MSNPAATYVSRLSDLDMLGPEWTRDWVYVNFQRSSLHLATKKTFGVCPQLDGRIRVYSSEIPNSVQVLETVI